MSPDPAWRYQVRAEGGRTIISVCGEIDLTGAQRFERLLLDAVRAAEAVVVDVAELRFIDSTVIGALVNGHNAAKARGGRLTLANPAAQVDRVLRMTGVLDELTI